MTDIDFEELDRAVNSHVNNMTTDRNNNPDTDKKQPDTTRPLQTSVRQQIDTKDVPFVPQKHSGTLIDIVHNSHNTPSSKKSAPQVGRKVIAPLGGGKEMEPDSAAILIEDIGSSPQYASDWPDPLDVSVPKKEPEDEENIVESNTNMLDTSMPDPLDNQETTPPVDTSYQPLQTPFLSDAKVEKRPLGSSENKETPQEKNSSVEGAEEVEPLRPEFGEEMIKVESKETSEVIPEDEFQDISTEPEKQINVTKQKEALPLSPAQATPITALLSTNSVVSIPQQYKRNDTIPEPHTDEPLFNAEHYQAPTHSSAHHPTGKTTTLQWLFIVVGLLLLGAVLGTVVFVFATGQSL